MCIEFERELQLTSDRKNDNQAVAGLSTLVI